MQMSKRFSVTLPDAVFEELEKLANEQGRTTANLAAFIVESGIREIKKTQLQIYITLCPIRYAKTIMFKNMQARAETYIYIYI